MDLDFFWVKYIKQITKELNMFKKYIQINKKRKNNCKKKKNR